jgi:DNA-binding CsgD family transcriptional regulator
MLRAAPVARGGYRCLVTRSEPESWADHRRALRDTAADQREHTADVRDAAADQRDSAADQRDIDADERDRVADERNHTADARELRQDARDHGSPTPSAHLDILSHRERDVLDLIVEGMSNDEVCARLFLSPNTVKGYIRSAYAKAHVTTRAQAVAWYLTGDTSHGDSTES